MKKTQIRIGAILKLVALVAFVGLFPLRALPQTVQTIHYFRVNPSDGVNPYAGLIQASNGNFYGTTSLGGSVNSGTVFQLSNGVVTVLHSFSYSGSDEAFVNAGLLQASDGKLYGTASGEGSMIGRAGTVFKLSTDPGNEMLTTVYSFSTNAPDGEYPEAGLIQGVDGGLYGTTSIGGSNGYGMVFRLDLAGNLTQLYAFTGENDGSMPLAGLVQGADGFLYGTASQGGPTEGGTVFRLSTNGVFSLMHAFTGEIQPDDGASPLAGLIQATDGNFYGTTSYGGSNFDGAVFRLSVDKTYTTIHSFNIDDGYFPQAVLVQASDGYLYGTTESGGKYSLGTIFRITTNGVFTSLYSFSGGANDGANPLAGLIQAADGNLYGTTDFGGGLTGNGTIFRVNLVTPSIQLGVLGLSGDILSLQATGLSGQSPVVFLSSTNLANWNPVLTNTPAGASSTVGQFSITGQPGCFFRAQQE